MISRRSLCLSAALAGLLGRASAASGQSVITVTDMAGRKVSLPARSKRIVLLEGRDLLTMSLLHPDPASLVIGWAAVDRLDSQTLQTALLNGHSIPVVGRQTTDSLSLESLIGLEPDLIVTTTFMTPPGGPDSLVQRLEELQIPVVFSDASSNDADGKRSSGPLEGLHAAMRMWGALLGAEEKADAFVAFAKGIMAEIGARLKDAAPVTTYLEVQSTTDDCCWAAGKNIWGELLEMAGGRPLPGVDAAWFQKLSLEYLLATPHKAYVATGGGWSSGSRPAIGPGINPHLGRQGLQRLVEGRPGFEQVESVRHGSVHGIWSGLISNAALNVLFVAVAAKWLHPDRCKDIDPKALLDTINREFAAFPIEGPLWVSL